MPIRIQLQPKKLFQQIQESAVFKTIINTAAEVALSRWRLARLLGRVVEKLRETNVGGKWAEQLKVQLMLFLSMLKAYLKGEYTDLPLLSLGKIVVGLLYFLIVPDFIPDILPIIGFADDFAVLMWVADSIQQDLAAFKQWQQSRHTAEQSAADAQ